MPISVDTLFSAAGATTSGVVPWGAEIHDDRPGVYCISWCEDPSVAHVPSPTYRPSIQAFATLLDAHPGLPVDGAAASYESFSDRLGRFWLPNEPVLYIGKAGTSMSSRIAQYYSTRLGARAPHSGGWWLKLIHDFDQSFVHFAACPTPDAAEQAMLQAFRDAADPAAVAGLHDPDRVAPFANVDVAKRLLKRHGLTNYKEKRSPVKASPVPSTAPSAPVIGERRGGMPRATQVLSQIVTDNDRAKSNLRIPAASKHASPDHPVRVNIEIHGVTRESFFLALKNERVHRTVYATKAQARRDLIRYIEGFNNSRRRHSALDYRRPNEVHYSYQTPATAA